MTRRWECRSPVGKDIELDAVGRHFRTLPPSQAYIRLRLHGGSLVIQLWLEKCGLIQRIPEARAGAVRQVEMMAATD